MVVLLEQCHTWSDDTVDFSGLWLTEVEIWSGRFQFFVVTGHHSHMVDLLRGQALCRKFYNIKLIEGYTETCTVQKSNTNDRSNYKHHSY